MKLRPAVLEGQCSKLPAPEGPCAETHRPRSLACGLRPRPFHPWIYHMEVLVLKNRYSILPSVSVSIPSKARADPGDHYEVTVETF